MGKKGPYVVLLANVGASDVQVSNARVLQGAGFNFRQGMIEKPRSDGRSLHQSYDKVQAGLDAPILRPVIELANQIYERIDSVILFCTDQPRGTPKEYREKDTLYFGKILAKLLPQRFNVGKVQAKSIRFNPASYDLMHEYFGKNLSKFVPSGTKWVILSLAGGTPASSLALLLNSLKFFRHKCICFYTLRDGTVVWLSITDNILKDFALEQAAALLDRHDYWNLYQLLTRAGLGDETVWQFSLAAAHRMYMDFPEAHERIQAALRTRSDGVLTSWKEQLRALINAPQNPTLRNLGSYPWDRRVEWFKRILAEQFWGMEVKAASGEWTDFLARWSNLMEAILAFIFESRARYPANPLSAIQKWVEDQGCYPPRLYKCPSRFVLLREIVSQWSQSDLLLKRVVDFVNSKPFTNLDTLRDRSIVGHGVRPISKKSIETAAGYSIEDLISQMRQLLEAVIGLPLDDNPFFAAQKYLRNQLF